MTARKVEKLAKEVRDGHQPESNIPETWMSSRSYSVRKRRVSQT